MYTINFGEVLTDIMTINPSFRDIASASAILDTSNYSFHTVSFSKDGQGFKFHGHTVSSVSSGIYNSGYLLVKRYNTLDVSSYHTSATYNILSSTYVSSTPCYATLYDNRLERCSTETNFTPTAFGGWYPTDNGQYLNPAIDPTYSSVWNVIGGFPPSGNVGKYMLVTSAGDFVCSGNMSGVYNSRGLVDRDGFIKVSKSAAVSAYQPADLSAGCLMISSTIYSPATFGMVVIPELGDCAALSLFGGIKHIGVWCLDIKSMLANSLTPPYTWSSLNTNRIYKLVAKITILDDPLLHHDFQDFFANNYSGLQNAMNTNTGLGGAAIFTVNGPQFSLFFNFI